jgi:hypothetical protein
MKRVALLFIILTNLNCGLYVKNQYESYYKNNFQSYKFGDVVVYLVIYQQDTEDQLFRVFYDEISKCLYEKGYKSKRLSDIEIVQLKSTKKINFNNFPLIEMPKSLEYSDSSLDSLFKNYRTVFIVEINPSYLIQYTYANPRDQVVTKQKYVIDACAVKYALLDSESRKVIYAGPGTPYQTYHRPRTDDQRKVPHYKGYSIEFSGYQMSEIDYAKLVSRNFMATIPAIRSNNP